MHFWKHCAVESPVNLEEMNRHWAILGPQYLDLTHWHRCIFLAAHTWKWFNSPTLHRIHQLPPVFLDSLLNRHHLVPLSFLSRRSLHTSSSIWVCAQGRHLSLILWIFLIKMMILCYSFTSETYDTSLPIACRAIANEGTGPLLDWEGLRADPTSLCHRDS